MFGSARLECNDFWSWHNLVWVDAWGWGFIKKITFKAKHTILLQLFKQLYLILLDKSIERDEETVMTQWEYERVVPKWLTNIITLI